MFNGYFLSTNNVISQKDSLWKAHEIVSKSKVVLMERVGNTGRKLLKPGRPGEVHENRETPGGTERVGHSVTSIKLQSSS